MYTAADASRAADRFRALPERATDGGRDRAESLSGRHALHADEHGAAKHVGGAPRGLRQFDVRPCNLQEQVLRAEADGKPLEARRLLLRVAYLSESPFSSMLRGFLVYLAIISGILLAISDPFEKTSADQFIRLAGLFSVIAFVMGYDPTRFEDLIETLSSLSHKAAGRK